MYIFICFDEIVLLLIFTLDYGNETGPECSSLIPCFCLKEGSPTQMFGNDVSWHQSMGENGAFRDSFFPKGAEGALDSATIDVKVFDETHAIACWTIANDLR